jgi:hypothetical protein
MKTKSFDCVEMMHRGAKRIYETTKSMSRKAELAYWQSRAKELLPAEQAAAHHAGVVREDHTAYRVTR